jgi:hypothetical protein
MADLYIYIVALAAVVYLSIIILYPLLELLRRTMNPIYNTTVTMDIATMQKLHVCIRHSLILNLLLYTVLLILTCTTVI